MIEQLYKLNASIEAVIRESFLSQPLMSVVALIITGFLLVLEYYIVTIEKRGHIDKNFLVESEHWLKEMRFKHFGPTFKPSPNRSVVQGPPSATDI